MKIKNIVLLLAVGLCTGVVADSSIGQLNTRMVSMGGEIFFIPMVCLLVWFGWMIRGEYRQIHKVRRADKSKRQG